MAYRSRRTFQKQVMRTFLPATILLILFSGIMMYMLGAGQVKKNARYLIANTTRQTAAVVDSKLELTLGKCSELNKTLALWRMVNHPYTEDSKTNEYQDMITVHKFLQGIYNDSNGAIDSIAFQTVYGNRLNVYYDMVYDYSHLSWDSFEDGRRDSLFWVNAHADEVFSTRIPREVFSLVIPYNNTKKEYTGLLVINFKGDYFRELLNEAEISRNGYVFLLSEDGCLMPEPSDNRSGLNEEQLDQLRGMTGSGDFEIWDQESREMLDIHYTPLKANSWTAVSVTPHSDLYSTLDNFKAVFFMIIVAAAILSVLVAVFCSRYVSRPIKELSEQVLAFEKNRDMVFGVNAGYEITTLAGGLNHLKTTIDRLLEQVREEQKQKSHLELMIMQSQIKPHFLYNTLGSIKALADLKESQKASSMCESLIRFYRISLSNGNSVITVGMEMELVDNYLRILEYRYGEKFEYSFEIEKGLEHAKIPRMLLQPLVENAVYHGIKPKDGGGMILVSGRMEDGFMVITVFDDGVGMDANTLDRLREDLKEEAIAPGKQGGFAMRNVYMRLKGFYGEQAGMKIDSVKDVYTQVQIMVPLDVMEGIAYVQTDDRG